MARQYTPRPATESGFQKLSLAGCECGGLSDLMKRPIVIAIDGTSASGKSTNSKLVARALGFTHVDTGAMYRALAWYCLKEKIELQNPKAIATACRKWKTKLECVDH